MSPPPIAVVLFVAGEEGQVGIFVVKSEWPLINLEQASSIRERKTNTSSSD